MARDSADIQAEKIPSIINDILLTRSLSRNANSSVHGFDNIVRSFSRQNCNDLPPLLLTEEDRKALQRDRENAVKCEEVLARRKEEQYFDLVDKVQNVLRRIEEKNLEKCKNSQSQAKDINNPIFTSAKSPSDFNNNPSQRHPDTYVDNTHSFTSPRHVQRNIASSNFGESWEKTRLPAGHQSNTGRYSLPANFETMYHPSAGISNGGYATGGLDTVQHTHSRPMSAFSDHHVVYGNQDGGGHEPATKYHSEHQRPMSEMSDHQILYGGINGNSSGPEAFHQQPSRNQRPRSGYQSDNQTSNDDINGHGFGSSIQGIHHIQTWNPKQSSTYTDYPPLYTNTPESMLNHSMQPHNGTNSSFTPDHSNTTSHSLLLDNSPLPQSGENHSSISKQKELLALEQKRLEDHYAALQGQLLVDFQQRQQELLQVYNKSLETQSGDQTMPSIMERSFESVVNTSDKENFTLLRTDELPQSPFGINVKKSSTSFQSSSSPDVARKKTCRPSQNSASSDARFKKNAVQNSASVNSRPKKSSKSFQNTTSPASLLQNSTSPDARRTKRSQNSIMSEQSFKNSRSSASIQDSTEVEGFARKSFNSEASAQEFYEIPRFGEKLEKREAFEKNKIGSKLERNVAKGSNKTGIVGKNASSSTRNFGPSVVTSPKRTQLSSFESQAMKNLKNEQSHKFFALSAHAKGFLTRLLFQTAKINGLVTTVKDAKSVLAELNTESGSQSMTDRSFKERVRTQLHSAQSELRKIFVDSPPNVRMQVLEQNRRLLQEKEARNASKVYSVGGTTQNRPKLSNVTMKKRLSRQESQEKTPKSEKSGTPNSFKTSRSVGKERNTPKSSSRNTPTTTTIKAKTTPKTSEKNEVSHVRDAIASGTAKETCLVSTVPKDNTLITATVVNTSVTAGTTPVTTNATTKTETKHDAARLTRNKATVKSGKASTRVTLASKNRRRTWDTSVLKPIQGRISPTIPRDKTKSSNEKRQSTLSTARKVGQKLAGEYQSSGTAGQTSTCEVSGIDMGKTYKVSNKPEQAVKKTGARRSLAANLSHK